VKSIPNWLGMQALAAVLASVFMISQSPAADTFTTIYSFCTTSQSTYCSADGQLPVSLIQANDGDFYGTTDNGGTGSWGTVFKITSGGTLTSLYSFCSPDTHPNCPDGDVPALLTQSTDGDFYRLTTWGGSKGDGTLFEMTPGSTRTTIHNFCSRAGCTDGDSPSGLVRAVNGMLYGTAGGGINGYGILYRIDPNGGLTTLYNFCSQTNCTDGGSPFTLIQGADGDFYGTTSVGGTGAGEPSSGGVSVGGIVFEITSSGVMTTLYNFCSQSNCTDGRFPAGLIQATDGDFYGVALEGGANNYGSVFKLTPGGALTTLYSFCSESTTKTKCTDGGTPTEIIQASDGNLYGTTRAGGAIDGAGTVFKMTRSGGKLAKLYTFCTRSNHRGCPDGESPDVLIQATDGSFYGATYQGGAVGAGTIFNLSTGLGPFVETQTSAGAVGSPVNILGNNLTGASSVTFNGIGAAFTVVSDSEITATIPSGATTGIVEVTTPAGTLESNKRFMVRQ